jgi:DNA (cytosine-5)-methyltransferase 1
VRFVACQSFAGAFDLGATQAGLQLVHKVEQKGGFGLANVDKNRHLVKGDWTMQACPPAQWVPHTTEIVTGNPPCSGFSPLSPKDFRGSGSPINECMHALVEYAARCGPSVVVFESVAQAFSGGRDLMQLLRDKLEGLTKQQWTLYHVKHNAASLGGCAIRRRYFWVASRGPFGVEPVELQRVPMLRDAIGDLTGLASTWEAQVPIHPASWWIKEQQMDAPTVDGHHVDWTPYARRAIDLIKAGETWGVRENIAKVAKRHFERTGDLPASWASSRDKTIAGDFNMGYNQLVRWNPDGMARVITGGALSLVLHPWEDRPITHREAARIMGFPDTWMIRPIRRVSGLRMTWGKQIPVQTGRWIAHWAKQSVEGQPGSDHGTLIGEREWLIDHTNLYRKHTHES